MDYRFRCKLGRHSKHLGRLLAVLVALPALVPSPLTARAFVVHDHHGETQISHADPIRV